MQTFLESMLRAALPHMRDDSAFYFWHPMLTQGTYVAAASSSRYLDSSTDYLGKARFAARRGDYHWRHELCFYGWQKGIDHLSMEEEIKIPIWEVASVSHKERKEMNHATPKPVALWDKPIDNHTRPSEIIYEPFAGSGTQIIAAEMKARRCFAIELDQQIAKYASNAGPSSLDRPPRSTASPSIKSPRTEPKAKFMRISQESEHRIRAARSGNGRAPARVAPATDA